ncbi:MAG: twin-arginine translocation pathway signal protein, partial [Betaproteobacteria bacterium]|nr:twin-arginine translocation pathway signal protein [Betaproteobacteria bacterium]
MVQSLGASALLAGFGRTAQAQVIETAKVVVGFPAGGTADVLCRRLAE